MSPIVSPRSITLELLLDKNCFFSPSDNLLKSSKEVIPIPCVSANRLTSSSVNSPALIAVAILFVLN